MLRILLKVSCTITTICNITENSPGVLCPVALTLPQDSEPFHIEADSLDFASRAILSQQLPREEKWHLVAFYSKFLSMVEWNYEIHDKEMLAIIHMLEEWRHFLEGTWHLVEI